MMLDRRIKFRHIQCFVEIARRGSFKQAAEALFLTQPAMSRTLRELEEIIGARLMERNRSGVDLTAQGRVFARFAEASLASLAQGVEGVARAGRAAQEVLSIGALPSVAASLMPDVCAAFEARAPQAVLRIVSGPHGYLLERLRAGALDLVVGRMGQPAMMEGLRFTQLYTEEVIFVTRPGHPLLVNPDLTQLHRWQVLCPPAEAAIAPLVERLLIARGLDDLPRRVETVSEAFGRVHVLRSDAVWIISGGVVAQDLADGRLARVPVDTRMTQGPVGRMTRADALPPPLGPVLDAALEDVLAPGGAGPR